MIDLLPKRLLAWYGDDFTGSTDVLEALASNGIRSVLFLQQPAEDFFDLFSDYAAFGIAGSSRSQSPAWMDEHLPSAFAWLRELGTELCHYKVCSTFDSSPQVGNIGRAIEIGKRVFESNCVPVLVGAPSLQRYVLFGNLFATANRVTWRIDRHPTMSRHPVTPMKEADLRSHLQAQTELPAASLTILDLSREDREARYRELQKQASIVLFDTLDFSSLSAAGRLLWDARAAHRFLTGSSGVEYALTSWWREQGYLPKRSVDVANSTDRVVVLSGSCSPVTNEQIADAGTRGFTLIHLHAATLAGGDGTTAAGAAVQEAGDALRAGRSVVLYTAGGPADVLSESGSNGLEFRHRLGERTGALLADVLDVSGVSRLVIAGGDTSSHAGRQLGIDALTYVAPLAPGAPLCRSWSRRKERNGLEIVFKGGQCGDPSFFSLARQGTDR